MPHLRQGKALLAGANIPILEVGTDALMLCQERKSKRAWSRCPFPCVEMSAAAMAREVCYTI